MKATKMRNNQMYRASLRTRSNQMGSPLSADLRKKYGRRSVRVIKGDTVGVLRGEYKGVNGKVASVSVRSGGIIIEGTKKEKAQGDKFDPVIHTSNVVVTGLNTSDSWRMTRIEGGKSSERAQRVAEPPSGVAAPEMPSGGADAGTPGRYSGMQEKSFGKRYADAMKRYSGASEPSGADADAQGQAPDAEDTDDNTEKQSGVNGKDAGLPDADGEKSPDAGDDTAGKKEPEGTKGSTKEEDT